MLSPHTAILGHVKSMLINDLDILKDEAFQRRVWFRQEGPEVSYFSDTIMHFKGNYEAIFEYSVSEEYLGKENYALLKKLYDQVSEHYGLIDDRIDPDLLEESELLDDPAWHDIQQLAEELDTRLQQFVKKESHDE